MRSWIHAGAGALWLLALLPAHADNVLQLGDFTIYYNAFGANLLDPAVAKAYKLGTGCDRGVLTVAVRKKDGSSAAAAIEAHTMTLIGQRSTITMREVRDGKALYYVGGFYAGNIGEPLKFDIAVTPADSKGTAPIKLEQRFYGC